MELEQITEETLQQLEKDELVQIILTLKDELLAQNKRIQELEQKLKQYDNPHTPSSKKRKKNTKQKEGDNDRNPGKRFPGKPQGSNGGGINLPEPDRTEEHTLPKDEIHERSLTHLGTREKTVINIPDPLIEVVKHVVHVYEDQNGNEILPAELPDHVYGNGLRSLTTLLRGTCGASHEKIATFFQQVRPDLTLSPPTILNFTDQIAQNLKHEREQILKDVKNNGFVHMDETSLRHDGENGWVWIYADPKHAVYEVNPSRSGNVPEHVMDGFNGTAVVDGYVGYNTFTRQRCWAHLIRDVKDVDEEAAETFTELYEKTKDAKGKDPPERETFVKTMKEKHMQIFLNGLRSNDHRKAATTVENALPDLFRGVINPNIPLTNNHAERLLRNIVIHRKLWGCIRNHKGKRFIENVLSCLESWKLQGKNVYQELQKYAA